MEKKKINPGLIIFIVIVVILFLPIIIDYYKSRNITVISSQELSNKINNGTENFIVYVGEAKKNEIKNLRTLRDKTPTNYSYEYDVFIVEESDDVKKLLGSDTEIAFIIEGDIQKVYTDYDFKVAEEYTDIYLIGNITDENKTYKVVEDFSNYKKLVKSDEVTMAVFGRNTCSYCNLFKVIYNGVAEKYNVDIYYFDSDSYDKNEYTKIINMDLTVPGKCNSTGNEFKLSYGFGTPLTIFTKKGKVVDCISGYVNRSSLVEKLVSLEMISE